MATNVSVTSTTGVASSVIPNVGNRRTLVAKRQATSLQQQPPQQAAPIASRTSSVPTPHSAAEYGGNGEEDEYTSSVSTSSSEEAQQDTLSGPITVVDDLARQFQPVRPLDDNLLRDGIGGGSLNMVQAAPVPITTSGRRSGATSRAAHQVHKTNHNQQQHATSPAATITTPPQTKMVNHHQQQILSSAIALTAASTNHPSLPATTPMPTPSSYPAAAVYGVTNEQLADLMGVLQRDTVDTVVATMEQMVVQTEARIQDMLNNHRNLIIEWLVSLLKDHVGNSQREKHHREQPDGNDGGLSSSRRHSRQEEGMAYRVVPSTSTGNDEYRQEQGRRRKSSRRDSQGFSYEGAGHQLDVNGLPRMRSAGGASSYSARHHGGNNMSEYPQQEAYRGDHQMYAARGGDTQNRGRKTLPSNNTTKTISSGGGGNADFLGSLVGAFDD